MTPPLALALLTSLCLGSALITLLTGAAWRLRARAEGDETDRRISALAERVARLEARAAEAPSASASPERPAWPSDAGEPPPRTAERARREPSAGPTLIAVPNLASAGAEPGGAAADLDRRYGPIWEMADSGVSADAIARATGQPIGQVELILGLRRPRASAGSRLP